MFLDGVDIGLGDVVLKDNINAKKVYESWGGKLSEFEEGFGLFHCFEF